MPHSAFQFEAVNEHISPKIESIETWGDRVLLGCADGSLLVLEEVPGANIPEYQVIDAKKDFAKSSITQIRCCESLGCVITLAEYIQINTLPGFQFAASLLKTKGANAFAVNTESNPPMLACLVRKKLVICAWNEKWFDIIKEINLLSEAFTVIWSGNSNVCVGYKKDYVLINIQREDAVDLFNTGNLKIPVVARMPCTDEILYARESFSVFQDFDGKPTRKYGLSWVDQPVALASSYPYVLALLSRSIEVQNVETQIVVQQQRIGASLLVCQPHRPGIQALGFVISNNSLYRLKPVPFERQIEQLRVLNEFSAALQLCQICPDVPKEKICELELEFAYHLYSKLLFSEAAHHFILSESSPALVLALYPDIAPPLPAPFSPHRLEAQQATQAIAAIVPYLQHTQNRLRKSGDTEAQELVDTSLLKALVRAKPDAVLPLLEKPNHCKFAESERTLLQHQMYHELVALHRASNNHKRALDLLKEYGQGPKEHPLHGVEPTIKYLRTLGKSYQQLVFDASQWVLRADPAAAINIFTNSELPSEEALPADAVLDHLRKFESEKKGTSPLRMVYLEYIIGRGDTSSSHHSELVLIYLGLLIAIARAADPRPDKRFEAGSEPGALGMARRRLLQFLAQSTYYNAEKMLEKFPVTELYEERALLLSRLGRHEEALVMYAHRLQKYKLAEEYCDRVYDPNSSTSDVHLALLGVYLSPSDGSPPLLQQAMLLMARHVDKIDSAKALDLLPSATALRALLPFFEAALRANTQLHRHQQVQKNLLKTENIMVWEKSIKAKSKRIVVTPERMCRVCNRRIGYSAFACYPNMVVVHFSCAKDRNVCPITNTVFGEPVTVGSAAAAAATK